MTKIWIIWLWSAGFTTWRWRFLRLIRTDISADLISNNKTRERSKLPYHDITISLPDVFIPTNRWLVFYSQHIRQVSFARDCRAFILSDVPMQQCSNLAMTQLVKAMQYSKVAMLVTLTMCASVSQSSHGCVSDIAASHWDVDWGSVGVTETASRLNKAFQLIVLHIKLSTVSRSVHVSQNMKVVFHESLLIIFFS